MEERKPMKKLLTLVLVCMTVLALASCTDRTPQTTPAPTPTADSATPDGTPTPDNTATPTPTPAPTPNTTPTLTPDKEVAKGMTEEELGVFPVGQYKITIPGVEGFVSFKLSNDNINDDKPLFISTDDKDNLFTIIYQTIGDTPSYTLSPNDEINHVIGLPTNYVSSSSMKSGSEVYANSRLRYTGTSNRTTQDSSAAIRWYFEKNEDGTYKMALRSSTNLTTTGISKYYASYEDGKIVLRKDTENKATNFKIEMVERGTNQFYQYISDGGKIALRLPPVLDREFIVSNDKTRVKFTDERAQKWANDVEDCYYSFIELTNYIPHENIIVKAYANTDYMAYVTNSYNSISISYSATGDKFGGSTRWFVEDINELIARGDDAADVNFCILHEMGHMFDIGSDWYFETESMTDFKLAYCLEKNGLSAIPSEFSKKDIFTYDNIEDAYLSLGKDISKTNNYTYYGAAYRMILIQKEIGWEPFRQTYHWFMENRTKVGTEDYVKIPSTKYEKCILFYTKVSEFAGKDVISMIPENEWYTWLTYMNKPQNVLPLDTNDIYKIELKDLNGETLVTLEDKAKCKELVSILNHINFINTSVNADLIPEAGEGDVMIKLYYKDNEGNEPIIEIESRGLTYFSCDYGNTWYEVSPEDLMGISGIIFQ